MDETNFISRFMVILFKIFRKRTKTPKMTCIIYGAEEMIW